MKTPLVSLSLAPLLLAGALPQLHSSGRLELEKPLWKDIAAGATALPGHGPALELELSLPADRLVTITVESPDFDAFLRIASDSGETLAEDDDGGFATNPRIVIELRGERSYRVAVAAPPGGSGGFWIRVESGEMPRPIGTELKLRLTDFHSKSLDSALNRGDLAAAGKHGLELGTALFELARYAEARDELEGARSNLARAGERALEAEVVLQKGRTLHMLGDHPGALALYEEALSDFRELGDRTNECKALLNVAEIQVVRGDHDEALRLCKQAEAIAVELQDPSTRAYAIGKLGNLYRERGELELARPLLEEQRRIVEELGDRARLAEALGDLGLLELAADRYEKAIDLLKRQLDITAELGDRAAEAKALGNLGTAYERSGNMPQAQASHEGALEIAREIRNRALESTALKNLGAFWLDVQDYAEALEHYAQHAEIADELGNEADVRSAHLWMAVCRWCLEGPAVAGPAFKEAVRASKDVGDMATATVALQSLASIEREAGRAQAALQLLEQAAELDPSPAQNVQLRWAYAWTYLRLGDIDRARREFEELLSLARSSSNRWLEASILEALTELRWKSGRYEEALNFGRQRLELSKELAAYVEEGRCHFSLGQIYLALGFPELAKEQDLEALEILGKEKGASALDRFQVHAELGRVWTELGEWDRARQSLEAMRQPSSVDCDERVEALRLLDIAYLEWRRGDLDASAEMHQAALELARRIRCVPIEYGAASSFSAVCLERGELDRARELSDLVLDFAAKSPDWEPRASLPAILTRASLALRDRRASDAAAALKQGSDILLGIRGESTLCYLGLGPTTLEWLACFDRGYQDLSRLLVEDQGKAEGREQLAESFQRADASRARSLLSGIVVRERGGHSEVAVRITREWRAKESDLQKTLEERRSLIRDHNPVEQIERLERKVQRLRREINERRQALLSISPRDAPLDVHEGVPHDVVRAALEPGMALVQYAEGETLLYAYVLTQDDLVLTSLEDKRAIQRAAEGFLKRVGSRATLGDPAEIAELGADLYRMLLATPLRAAPKADRLVLVPTPMLSGLPFESLVLSAPAEPRSFADLTFVIDRYTISYAPSASVLVRLADGGQRRRDGKLLVLADPVYPGEESPKTAAGDPGVTSLLSGARAAGEPRSLVRLVSSREEAFGLADMFVLADDARAWEDLGLLKRQRSGSVSTSRFDLHVGDHASRVQLTGASLKPYAMIHLAAHGLIGSSPSQTGIALAASGQSDYDGFLTIADVLDLDLDANLVVLSACDSARGKVLPGEGVESMANAFLYAGARSVVASLWPVDDEATAETMKAFYGAKEGTPTVWLRDAKLRLKEGSLSRGRKPEERPIGSLEGHPYFWAAFVHIGLPR